MKARFLDETTHFDTLYENTGSNELLTNELGETILREIQVDPYEPIEPADLDLAISEVKDFYLRNTDGEFEIVPVVLPTLTLPIPRYMPTLGPEGDASGANPYDSSGQIAPDEAEIKYEALGMFPAPLSDPEVDEEGLMGHALSVADFLNDDWSPLSARFVGVSKISLVNTKIDTNFTSLPLVTVEGGGANGSLSKFVPAKAEVVLDDDGDVVSIQVIDPGAFYKYGSSPQIFLNGVDYSSEFTSIVENMLVSIVLLTNYDKGAPGLGSIGKTLVDQMPYFPVAHVQITDGEINSTTLAHEIGHNLGLFHAERYLPRSEKPISDDGDQIEYGNPYSIMGGAPGIITGGDFTVPGKIALHEVHQSSANDFMLARLDDPIGYKLDVNAGADVADLNISILTDQNGGYFSESGDVNNTYRIYRSNYHAPPLPLKEANFTVKLPSSLKDELNTTLSPYNLSFLGSGLDANGSLHHVSDGLIWNLSINNGGRGFVENPQVKVLDTNLSDVLLALDPAWIQVPNGRDYNATANLLDQNRSNRWIRGIRIACDEDSRKPLNVIDESKDPPEGLVGYPLSDYFLSYRSDVSSYGLALLLGTQMGSLEELFPLVDAFMLDATPQTPQNFDDAALMIGSTYSDYDADIHITPIRKRGKDPMPFVEVVVNIGSVGRGEAQTPKFELLASSTLPQVGDEVFLTVKPQEINATYAYSWYINEQALNDPSYLNQSSIRLKIDTVKTQVVRALVTDMKGGVASRNLVITTQGDELTSQSTLTGKVRSGSGLVQGARVILEKAPIIEHNVSLSGDWFYSYFPDGENSPVQYLIDGELTPDIRVRRGEIHRFYFDKSMDGHPFSFLQFPENAPPRFRLNMLSDPQADATRGSGYLRNPEISYSMGSAFYNNLSTHTGIYTDFNQSTLSFVDSKSLINRPYAKAVMLETNVSKAIVGPLEINEFGYFTFGGVGYHQSNVPKVEVKRTSIWEDYSNRNATAVAYVDGVGTISPVNADQFLNNEWVARPNDTGDQIPQVKFIGLSDADSEDSLNEANATVLSFVSGGKTKRKLFLTNQGRGYEPNSTMAVLHYPLNPRGYWTFDRHESLFEDSNQARHLPSPSWNREQNPISIKHYWKFDSNKSGSVEDEKGFINLSSSASLTESDFATGLIGKALNLVNNESLEANNSLDDNYTFSIWVKPEGNFSIVLGDINVTYDTSENLKYKFGPTPLLNPQVENYWTHIAVASDNGQASLFIDGREANTTLSTSSPSLLKIISISAGSTLFDECRIYDSPLKETEILYLGGRSFLDLSGNRYNAVPRGTNAFLTAPGENISSSEVPASTAVVNSPNGSGRLGDSYPGESHGLSLSMNGSDQYLDLSCHASEFALSEGSISLWVKPNSTQKVAPLFSVANPFVAVLEDANTSTHIISEPGEMFSFDLENGRPKAGLVRSNTTVVNNVWTHLACSFGVNPAIWVDGVRQNLLPVTPQSIERFDELTDPSAFYLGAELFTVGHSFSKTDNPLPAQPSKIFFKGSIDDLAIYDRILTDSEVSFLYNLNKGREQIPRLEVLVDAVGTVDIEEGGSGYTENPDLVFWYGQDDQFESNLTSFPSVSSMEGNFTDNDGDFNGSLGQFAYVDGSVNANEKGVWSFHMAIETNSSYNWRKGETDGWRKHIPAAGIVEYEDASLGDVVWTKRMDSPVDLTLPDGRIIKRRYVEYITRDVTRSLHLELNSSSAWNHSYFQPRGLYGFNERVDLNVSSGGAKAHVLFWVDEEDNDSVTIIDSGHGIEELNSSLIKISGKGYQPSSPSYSLFKQTIPFQEEEKPNKSTTFTYGMMSIEASDYRIMDWNGSHEIKSDLEFNQTLSSISVNHGGFGYSMPVQLKMFGGLPQPNIDDLLLESPGQLLPYDTNLTRTLAFREAIFEVNETNESGAILDLEILDGGHGYISYQNHVDLLDDGNPNPWLNDGNYSYTQFPIIAVSGGGGNGAIIYPILDENGSVVDVNVTSGGRGYFNIDSNNSPKTSLAYTSALNPTEREANISIRLGGYLREIPRCSGCESNETHKPADSEGEDPYSHLEPWIEIWDRGRPEIQIDSIGVRAHAAARVVNGRVEDVIVTKSGYGYIDPVAYVRDAPPKHYKYYYTDFDAPDESFRRKWRCTYLRLNADGEEVECGHTHWNLYPPEECPGEIDETLTYYDDFGNIRVATPSEINDWNKRHLSSDDHRYCNEANATSHLSGSFLSRKCWGTKTNYVLEDPYYRTPRQDWLHMDTNLSVITENGRIREIIVNDTGLNYYASQIAVVGSGTGVDAIPVFDEYGINTEVFFHDERQRNLELDKIVRPAGAGQGFIERPWSWDARVNSYYKKSVGDSPHYTWKNEPLTGFQEVTTTYTRHSLVDYFPEGVLDIKEYWENDGGDWSFGQPVLADALGDRIVEVEVLDPGIYEKTRTDFGTISVDFNSSHVQDHDRNGSMDFIDANLSAHNTFRLTQVILDGNGTYDDNSSDLNITKSLYSETPIVRIVYDESGDRGTVKYDQDDVLSDYIRLNNRNLYDPLRDNSYVDLYIDDRFPNQLFYGYGQEDEGNKLNFPTMGGKIIVSESLPGLNWAINEPLYKPHYSYTDQFGQYAFSELEPGLYNLAVLMEDQGYQESTFRPEANKTRVSQPVYVPGFPELTLETDNGGLGKSRLVWSRESRLLSRPFYDLNYSEEYISEYIYKTLEGIGRGFLHPLHPRLDPETLPELIFIPDPENISKVTPNIIMGWDTEHDGSIALRITDDENTSRYYPGDKFTVRFSTLVEGQDFFESYLYTESNQSFDSGVIASWDYDPNEANRSRYVSKPRLIIFPNDGNGTNPIEMPLSTESQGKQSLVLDACVYDANGSYVSATIDWQIHLDFNSTEGNNSRVAHFEDTNTTNVTNKEQVNLLLFSTLREGVGSVHGFEIVAGGSGYQQGDKIILSGAGQGFEANITDVNSSGAIQDINVTRRGYGIPKNTEISIWDENLTNYSGGVGAVIKPIFPQGFLEVEVSTIHNGTSLSEKVRIRPSMRSYLTSKEVWLNKYLDSFMEQNLTWWDPNFNTDNDSDGDHLTNLQEWEFGTNPVLLDSDGDGLDDKLETDDSTNPLIIDTDGDGLSDFTEKVYLGTNALLRDTDGDGLNDPNDLEPLNASGDGIISGRIFKKSVYGDSSVSTVYFRYAKSDDIDSTLWSDTWNGQPTSFYIEGLTDGNYTVQAFVDYYSPRAGQYTYGEPIAEVNVTLANGKNVYGKNLITQDPLPVIYFDDDLSEFSDYGLSVVNDSLKQGIGHLEQNITIEANATNAQNLSEFEWGIIGKDPQYVEENNVSSTTSGITFKIIDGNFSQFLEIADGFETSFEGITAKFDLGSVPVGKYFLTYTVEDEFGNEANHSVTQNIDVRDAEPPEISFIFQGGGVTTLSSSFIEASGLQSSNSSAVLEWDITDVIRFSDQFDEESDILIQLFDLKNHFEDDFSNANQPNWNVEYSYSNDLPDPYSTVQDIEGQNLVYGIPVPTDQSFELDANLSGTYKLEFAVVDQSGNTLDYTLYIILKPGAEFEITAVDGYLSNATVIFDADGDGISDLNRNFYTDVNGRTKIILSQHELELFDLNQNGKLDPDEGKFIVIGGIDTSTGTKFSGKLIADANSSVVSPLTTIISKMMDLGATKDEAITALALALDLDSSIDFTSYDPIQEAFDGDQRATDVMLANLRMANLINQAEGLLLALSSDYQGYEVGSNLLGEVAKQINAQISEEGINLEEILIDALPIALASVGTSAELTLEDQLAMYQLMVDLDHTIAEYEDGLEFSEVMQKQKDTIHDLEDLFDNISSDEQVLSLRYHQLDISYQTGGTAGESGLYPYGSKVAIFAEAQTGYFFEGWAGDGILDRNAATTFVTMIKDRNLTAQFLPKTYEVSLLSDSGGQVSGGGAFQYGEEADLNAVADEGGEFLGWFKDGQVLSSETSLQITVDQDILLTAKFTQPLETRTLVLSSDAGGSVMGAGTYNLGETAHIQALAEPNFVFNGWLSGGVNYANSSSSLVVMDESYSLHASFVHRPESKQTLVIKSNPVFGGSTSGAGAYNEGDLVNIMAEAQPGYVFAGWTGSIVSDPSNQSATILIDQHHVVEANFLPIDYQLTTRVVGQGQVLGGGEYPFGTLVNLTALPETGYRFVGWSDLGNGFLIDQNITYKITENTVFEAQFEPESYTLAIHSSSGGLVYGAGEYVYGSMVGIEAHPATGFSFIGWSGNAMTGVDTPFHTLTIVEDTLIEATFSPIDNYFTPRAENFEFWIDRTDYDVGEIIHVIQGMDGDQDEISYSLVSGKMDRDGDGKLLLGISHEGLVSVEDPDEIFLSSGNTFKIVISMSDQGGKSSLTEGTIKIRPKFILESNYLGNDWYESNWMGYFLTTQNLWIYHQKLGWLFLSPMDHQGYWFWDSTMEDWLWTDSTFYPWLFSSGRSSWYYFNIDEEKVRFFNHNEQRWSTR